MKKNILFLSISVGFVFIGCEKESLENEKNKTEIFSVDKDIDRPGDQNKLCYRTTETD